VANNNKQTQEMRNKIQYAGTY